MTRHDHHTPNVEAAARHAADNDTTLPHDYGGDHVCAPTLTHADHCTGPNCWACAWLRINRGEPT